MGCKHAWAINRTVRHDIPAFFTRVLTADSLSGYTILFTATREFHVARRQRGRKQLRDGTASDVPIGHVPRIARLMALAIYCDQLIREGVVADQSELAHFGNITTARMTQIMTLLNLAPDIQEQMLFLPRTERGRDVIKATDVRPIAAMLDWRRQRQMWRRL